MKYLLMTVFFIWGYLPKGWSQGDLLTKAALEFQDKEYAQALANAKKVVENPGDLKPNRLAKAYAIIVKSSIELAKDSTYLKKFPHTYEEAYDALLKVNKYDEKKNFQEELINYRIQLGQALLIKANDQLIHQQCQEALNNIAKSDECFKASGIEVYNTEMLRGFALNCTKQTADSMKAITAFENALARYQKTLDNPKTQPAYKEQLLKDKNIPAIYTQLIVLYASVKKDIDLATATLEKAKQKYSEDKGLQEAEFFLFQNPSLMNKAISTYEAKIQQNPNDANNYIRYALLLEQKAKADESAKLPEQEVEKSIDKAIELYKKAVNLAPNNALAVFNLGVLYINKAAALEKIINDLPPDKEKETQELTQKKNNYLQQALPHMEKAHALEPKNVTVIKSLFNIHAVLGDLDKAKIYRQKLAELGAMD
ncbi:MAG: tetratricopeptide repeat protein [Bacteroidia bacterium]|nr:tetratricopeptide repeat protein [Bacteroidia bacterium]MDW8158895.1 tetratricopeptide repeat protein [Bacteroidia bacterium]